MPCSLRGCRYALVEMRKSTGEPLLEAEAGCLFSPMFRYGVSSLSLPYPNVPLTSQYRHSL